MKDMNWLIRPAKPDDAENLRSCMIAAYSEYLKILGGKRLPPMDVDYKKEIASFPVWVAEYDNRIAGGLILMFEDDYTTIANVAVSPDFQGKGLGKGLMDFAESEARRNNYSELRLATHVLLTANLSFYTKLGWTEIDRDETRVYMKKNIT